MEQPGYKILVARVMRKVFHLFYLALFNRQLFGLELFVVRLFNLNYLVWRLFAIKLFNLFF